MRRQRSNRVRTESFDFMVLHEGLISAMTQMFRLWALVSAIMLHFECDAVMFDLSLSSKSVCELEVIKSTVELDCVHRNTEIAVAWIGVFPTYVRDAGSNETHVNSL